MRVHRSSFCAVLGLACALGSVPASSLDLWDGRVQIHGYYELQLRAIARDFDAQDGWDLTQWYNIFNVEIEADIAPDGIGPLDLVSGFARLEARFDCVWKRGCWMFPSVNAFGDRTKRLPKRLADGRRAGYRSTGNIFNGDTRFFRDIPRESLPFRFRDRPRGSRKLSPWFNIQGIDTLFDSPGADGVFGTEDDPAPFYFSKLLSDQCDFTFRGTKGSQNGIGTQVMGPWQPACEITSLGQLRDKPNPLRAKDFNPITGGGGSGALPLRPAPRARAGSSPLNTPQGIYYPNAALLERIQNGDLDDFDQNFSENDLAWNRGASQQDEYELKELYFDLEMFDSRLWLRLGKQAVVWGKTELFRNQDQWNPQDLALASLPSLEESRIGQWMARGVWHFWDVGPLEDFRAELVVLYDDFEPTDIGRCGEPYTPNPACNKTLGLYVHSVTGFGVAGETRPPNPWNSWAGIEVGGRLEWRWSRFSFALSDYWGFTDLPYQESLFAYSRNVDPATGRPRHTQDTGSCRTGREAACLRPTNALKAHSVNQQLFSMICATSIGFSTLDLAACGQTVFNSQNIAASEEDAEGNPVVGPFDPPVVIALTNLLAGQLTPAIGGAAVAEGLGNFTEKTLAALDDFPDVYRFLSATFGAGTPTPLVPLSMDPNDGPRLMLPDPGADDLRFRFEAWSFTGLSPFLTDQQEALLGCGAFYGTNCDFAGVDLMNAEASAFFQSFPGIAGTSGPLDGGWDTRDRSRAQPGTIGFDGGPTCTRYERGRAFILPGCRGPGDSGYDSRVDGTLDGPRLLSAVLTTDEDWRVHPFTGQRFRSELAVVSWNAMIGLVVFSEPDNPSSPTISDFVPDQPFRTNGCSLATPLYCSVIQSFYQITGVQRNTVRAGGNGRFGRRDFTWHGGKDVMLRYQKRNILGFSADFAEDFTKSNIGLEFTWEDDVFLPDNDEFSGNTEVDRYNLTVSVDRPTFINFLNANRTFFINGQVFFQYVDGFSKSFTGNGPFNILGVLTITTGYFDDRLLPSMNLVYDMGSNSGAWIPQIQYRYTAEFSVAFGIALFSGREQSRNMAISPTSLSNRTGSQAFTDFAENGLSAVRDRDEVFLRARYTF